MTAKILDGKKMSAEIRATIKEKVVLLKEKGIVPGLAVILVGDNPASKVYVGQKEKGCLEAGFASFLHRLPETTSQEELLALIDKLNADKTVHGILCSFRCRARSILIRCLRRFVPRRMWTASIP